MTNRSIYSLAATLLAAASLYAEPPIKAHIPFPFHVGNSILPAGSYTTDVNISSGLVLGLRSDDGKSAVMVFSHGVESFAAPAEPKLVFHRYGNQYFHYQVWTGAGGAGRELVKSRPEIEIEAAAKRSVQTIVATR